MNRTLLVVGAGKAGTAICRAAMSSGHNVRVLDSRPEHVSEAVSQLSGAMVTLGSGTDPADLEAAGIRACDTLVAATGSDEVNLVTATLARFEFGVDLILARVVDPRNRWLFDEDMGVDVPLDDTALLAELVDDRLGPDPD